jgi:hypothetical protein
MPNRDEWTCGGWGICSAQAPSKKDGLIAEAFSKRALETNPNGGFGRMPSIMGNPIGDATLDVVIGRIRILDA